MSKNYHYSQNWQSLSDLPNRRDRLNTYWHSGFRECWVDCYYGGKKRGEQLCLLIKRVMLVPGPGTLIYIPWSSVTLSNLREELCSPARKGGCKPTGMSNRGVHQMILQGKRESWISQLALCEQCGSEVQQQSREWLVKCERSIWITLLLENKAAEPTLQTLQKLMRTKIQPLRDMRPSQSATEAAYRRTAAVWKMSISLQAL